MSLPDDLLEQARTIARQDARRPKQASLRRAVSTGYYALFHFLIAEATIKLVAIPGLRSKFARVFEHGIMKEVSRSFGNPNVDVMKLTGGLPIPVDLRFVAEAFVALQEARHEADYDPNRNFSKLEVTDALNKVDQSFESWNRVRDDPVAGMYLAALMIGKRWNR